MVPRKVLVMGLPGAGKTTFATALMSRIDGVLFNADEVRNTLSADLGFALPDRIEQARRMGWLCDIVVRSGHNAIADFVCPTAETREAFGHAFTIWIDGVKKSRFDDTNALFQQPERFDIRVTRDYCVEYWLDIACNLLNT